MTAGAAEVVLAPGRDGQTLVPRSRRPPRRVGFGALRALAVLPAVCGGLLVAMTLTAGLGTAGGLLFLAWVGAGALLCTVRGERLAVRRMCRFRPPTQRERQLLGPVAMMALVKCGLRPGTVDWYVPPGREANACAAGKRSVAVTEQALESFVSSRLPADQLMRAAGPPAGSPRHGGGPLRPDDDLAGGPGTGGVPAADARVVGAVWRPPARCPRRAARGGRRQHGGGAVGADRSVAGVGHRGRDRVLTAGHAAG